MHRFLDEIAGIAESDARPLWRAAISLVSMSAKEEFDLAASAFERAARRGHPGALVNLGNVFERRGELDAAEDAFLRAERRGIAVAALNLGHLLKRRGDLAGAERAWERAEQLDQDE